MEELKDDPEYKHGDRVWYAPLYNWHYKITGTVLKVEDTAFSTRLIYVALEHPGRVAIASEAQLRPRKEEAHV